jgi:hypothetical protein
MPLNERNIAQLPTEDSDSPRVVQYNNQKWVYNPSTYVPSTQFDHFTTAAPPTHFTTLAETEQETEPVKPISKWKQNVLDEYSQHTSRLIMHLFKEFGLNYEMCDFVCAQVVKNLKAATCASLSLEERKETLHNILTDISILFYLQSNRIINAPPTNEKSSSTVYHQTIACTEERELYGKKILSDLLFNLLKFIGFGTVRDTINNMNAVSDDAGIVEMASNTLKSAVMNSSRVIGTLASAIDWSTRGYAGIGYYIWSTKLYPPGINANVDFMQVPIISQISRAVISNLLPTLLTHKTSNMTKLQEEHIKTKAIAPITELISIDVLLDIIVTAFNFATGSYQRFAEDNTECYNLFVVVLSSRNIDTTEPISIKNAILAAIDVAIRREASGVDCYSNDSELSCDEKEISSVEFHRDVVSGGGRTPDRTLALMRRAWERRSLDTCRRHLCDYLRPLATRATEFQFAIPMDKWAGIRKDLPCKALDVDIHIAELMRPEATPSSWALYEYTKQVPADSIDCRRFPGYRTSGATIHAFSGGQMPKKLRHKRRLLEEAVIENLVFAYTRGDSRAKYLERMRSAYDALGVVPAHLKPLAKLGASPTKAAIKSALDAICA